jgi:hypothetical protein
MKCLNCKIEEAKRGCQFCSKSCRYSYFSGDRNPAKRKDVRQKLKEKARIRELNPDYSLKLWQRNKYGWITKTCLFCNTEFSTRRCYHRKFCSFNCSKLYHVGKNHHFPYIERKPGAYGYNWPEQKRKVKERDKNICQICGKNQSQNFGQNMDIHHLIPFLLFTSYEQANKLENLTSLCIECHRRQKRKLSWFRDNDIVRTALEDAEIDRNVLSLLKSS